MKKLEKYKIAPQAKFAKFKVKHFVEIPTIRRDKAVLCRLFSEFLVIQSLLYLDFSEERSKDFHIFLETSRCAIQMTCP